jgi:hypothetical protein
MGDPLIVVRLMAQLDGQLPEKSAGGIVPETSYRIWPMVKVVRI